MSHTPPDLSNISLFKFPTPARNALEQEAAEILGDAILNPDGPAIEEDVVQHNLEQIEFGPNPNVMPADHAIGEEIAVEQVNVHEMEVVQGMEPQINMHELDANVNLPRANETVDWVLTKIILMNEDKYLGSTVKTWEPVEHIQGTRAFEMFVQPDVFVVDRILLRRRKNRRIEYLMEWTRGEHANFSKIKMASIRSKTISKNAPKNASEKTYISKLKGNDQIITPLSQLKELASEKISYHTIKGEIEGVKHFIYTACVKCGRNVKDGNHCAFCGILCVPKTKLFFKLSIADESGSVHNVSCFDAKIAKFLGIKIGTNEDEIAELLQKIMGIGSIMVRLSVKKEIYDKMNT